MRTRLNKKIATALLAGLLTVSLLPMTANACRGGRGGQGGGCAMKGGGQGWKNFGSSLGVWRNAQMVKDLGLNDEQIHKIKEADFTAQEKQQALRAEMNSLHLKMDQAFSENTVDEKAVRELSKKVAVVKGKMIEQRTETRLLVHKLFTPEQLEKLNAQRGPGQGVGKNGNGANKPCMMNGQGGGNGMKKGQEKM